MALKSPNDPFPSDYSDTRPSNLSGDYTDPEARSPMGGGRIAAMIIAVALAIGAVYFGMNASSTGPNQPAVATSTNAPAASTTAQNASPSTGPAIRDVTPNREPGVTTGSAPMSSSPSGSDSAASPAR